MGTRCSTRPPWSLAAGCGWLVLILIVGVGLRLYQINDSLWVDELHTSWVVADGFQPITARAWQGNQSPLYFVVVWASVGLLGPHEWTLRLPSLLAGVFTIGLVAWVVRRWTGSVAISLFAALLVALNRDCIFYSQEARPYAFVLLVALGHGYLFVALLVRPTRTRRLLFVVGGLLLFYLHYTAFLFLFAELVYAGICWLTRQDRRTRNYRPGPCLFDFGSMAIFSLPAWPHLIEIASRRDAWAPWVSVWPSPALWNNLFIYGAIPLVGLWAGRWWRLTAWPSRLANARWLWTACWFGVPLLVAYASTLSGVAALWMLRYLVASLIGMLLFSALCLSRVSDVRYRFILGLAVLGGTILHGGIVSQWQRDGRLLADRQEDWRAAVQWLNTKWPAKQLPVLLLPGLLEDLSLDRHSTESFRRYCCFPLLGLYRFQGGVIEPSGTSTRRPLCPPGVALARESGGAWVVIRSPPARCDEFAVSIERSLSNEAVTAEVVERRAFGNVLVLRVRLVPTWAGEVLIGIS